MATTTQKKVENTANQAIDKTKDFVENVADKAKQGAGAVADKAKDVASSVAEGASHLASSAVQGAQHLASSAVQGVDNATSAVGSGAKTLADTVRKNTPDEGMIGTASNKLAEGLEASGKYLEEQGMSGMVDDVTGMIKRNPIGALFVGIGIGYLLARATSSRS